MILKDGIIPSHGKLVEALFEAGMLGHEPLRLVVTTVGVVRWRRQSNNPLIVGQEYLEKFVIVLSHHKEWFPGIGIKVRVIGSHTHPEIGTILLDSQVTCD